MSEVAQHRDQGLSSYRKPNAHSSGKGARNELALVKLDQQRRLPHTAVSDQDCLQGPGKEASAQGAGSARAGSRGVQAEAALACTALVENLSGRTLAVLDWVQNGLVKTASPTAAARSHCHSHTASQGTELFSRLINTALPSGFEIMEPLCLSSPAWALPWGAKLACPQAEGAVQVSEMGHCHHLWSSSHAASPWPWYPHRTPGEPILPSAPARVSPNAQPKGHQQCKHKPLPPSLPVSGFCLQSHRHKHPHPLRKLMHFQPFYRDTSENKHSANWLLVLATHSVFQDNGVPVVAALATTETPQCPPVPCHPYSCRAEPARCWG